MFILNYITKIYHLYVEWTMIETKTCQTPEVSQKEHSNVLISIQKCGLCMVIFLNLYKNLHPIKLGCFQVKRIEYKYRLWWIVLSRIMNNRTYQILMKQASIAKKSNTVYVVRFENAFSCTCHCIPCIKSHLKGIPAYWF